MAGGAARLRAGSAGPVAGPPGPSRGLGNRRRTTPRAASRSGYAVPSAKDASPSVHDPLEVCGSSYHTARGSRPNTAGAPAMHSRGGIPKGQHRPSSHCASPIWSPPIDSVDSAGDPVVEPMTEPARRTSVEEVYQAPTTEADVEKAAGLESAHNEDPWSQRLARLERIRLGLASVSTERPWAIPRPAPGASGTHRSAWTASHQVETPLNSGRSSSATARPSSARNVRSTQSTSKQKPSVRGSGHRGGGAALESTNVEAAAVLAAAMSDAELLGAAPEQVVSTTSFASCSEELYQPLQPPRPPLVEPPLEPLTQPANCWLSPSANSGAHAEPAVGSPGVSAPSPYDGESPQRPLHAPSIHTPVSRGSDLLNAEVLYDSVVESSCSSTSWPQTTARAGKCCTEMCVDMTSDRLPEPAWSVESTVAGTPDLLYRKHDSAGSHSIEAGLSLASIPSSFPDLNSGRSLGVSTSHESSQLFPLQPQRSDDLATMCLYGKAYGPPSTSSTASPEFLEANVHMDVASTHQDGDLYCQGHAVAMDRPSQQSCSHSMPPQSTGEHCRSGKLRAYDQGFLPDRGPVQEQQTAFSLSSGVPLLVYGHSVGDSNQNHEKHFASGLGPGTCKAAAGEQLIAAQGFDGFLNDLRSLRSEALRCPASASRSEDHAADGFRSVEDTTTVRAVEAGVHHVERDVVGFEKTASGEAQSSVTEKESDWSEWTCNDADTAAPPVTDGSTLLELQQFLRRSGVEDLMSVIHAHAADNLDALLALPAPVIRRLPANRARLQRLVQALTTERGRRVCSWVSERNDVLRSQEVLRRSSSVQRGASARRSSTRSQCTPTGSRFQPGPRTRKTAASQPRSQRADGQHGEKEPPIKARASAPKKQMVPASGPAPADGCDDHGFFITGLESPSTQFTGGSAHGNPIIDESSQRGSAEADADFFCPPTRSSSSTAPIATPASSSASMPSSLMPFNQDRVFDASTLEQRLELAAPMQSETPQASSAEPSELLPHFTEVPSIRASAGLAEQTPQAALPSSHLSARSHAASRPSTRRARIRQLLQHVIELAPCPIEAARVDARQQQAYERHMRLRSKSPGSRRGTDEHGETAPASVFRRSRSLMDLVSDGPTLLELSMADPPGWRPRRGPACPDPVPAELLDSLLERLPTVAASAGHTEQCTICLDVPEPGEMLTTLPCCHWYHRECIREWLSHSRLCPLCKASAMPEDVD